MRCSLLQQASEEMNTELTATDSDVLVWTVHVRVWLCTVYTVGRHNYTISVHVHEISRTCSDIVWMWSWVGWVCFSCIYKCVRVCVCACSMWALVYVVYALGWCSVPLLQYLHVHAWSKAMYMYVHVWYMYSVSTNMPIYKWGLVGLLYARVTTYCTYLWSGWCRQDVQQLELSPLSN